MDKQENLESLRAMISAVIYGLVIGDSLGVPVEFEERDNYILDDMIGYGTYHQPPGAIVASIIYIFLLKDILSNDTDTIGAITGTLAGAKYSLASIPKEWIEKLANKALIDEKCEQLFNRIIKV